MADAIEIAGLTKRYRSKRGRVSLAVDRLDLTVPEGGVFGFLGPNGSGKTTTIRCLLGLVHATSGAVKVLGADVPGALGTVICRVGAVAEGAPHLPSMTAREQLRLLAEIDGIGRTRVDEVLRQVSIEPRADEPTRRFSMGMRQRLAVAGALLKDPALLILDEPANGLDPAGMRDLRLLLRALGDEGRTVFISSHLLGEIEQICDSVAIVNRGRLVVSGGVDEVARGRSGCVLVHLAVPDRAPALELLGRAGLHAQVVHDGVRVDGAEGEHVAALLGAARIWPRALIPERPTLESLFLELTESTVAEGAAA